MGYNQRSIIFFSKWFTAYSNPLPDVNFNRIPWTDMSNVEDFVHKRWYQEASSDVDVGKIHTHLKPKCSGYKKRKNITLGY